MVRPQTVGRAFSFSGWFDRIHLSRGCVGWTTSKWRGKSTRMAHSLCFHCGREVKEERVSVLGLDSCRWIDTTREKAPKKPYVSLFLSCVVWDHY